MRFTDEKKWSDKWFRSLAPCHKIVWIYICDSCDIAGFYEVDIESIAFHTKLSEEDSKGAIEGLLRGYLGAKDSDLIWIKNFLKHQNNNLLNPNNNCHKGIIKRIEMNLSLFPSIPSILGATEGLFSPTSNSNSKGKSKKKEIKVFIEPTLEDVKVYFAEKGFSEQSAITAFNYYDVADWVDSKGTKIKNWKQKMQGVWFKDENRNKADLTKEQAAERIKNHNPRG